MITGNEFGLKKEINSYYSTSSIYLVAREELVDVELKGSPSALNHPSLSPHAF
jgi:hypothetical protein